MKDKPDPLGNREERGPGQGGGKRGTSFPRGLEIVQAGGTSSTCRGVARCDGGWAVRKHLGVSLKAMANHCRARASAYLWV